MFQKNRMIRRYATFRKDITKKLFEQSASISDGIEDSADVDNGVNVSSKSFNRLDR